MDFTSTNALKCALGKVGKHVSPLFVYVFPSLLRRNQACGGKVTKLLGKGGKLLLARNTDDAPRAEGFSNKLLSFCKRSKLKW